MLTEKEVVVLSHLRGNARKTLTKISDETSIPKSTILDQIRKLEKKVIKKHVSLVDFSKVGYSLRVNFALKAEDKRKLVEFLLKSHSTNSVYRTTDKYDYYVECVFKSMMELHDFKDELMAYQAVEMDEHFLIEDIMRECFLVNNNENILEK